MKSKRMKGEIKFLKELRRELKRKAEPEPTWYGWGYIDMIILKRLNKLNITKESK